MECGVREYWRTALVRSGSQPTPHSLPIGVIFLTEMLLHEPFFERDQPEINDPEKENRRNNKPEALHGEEASNGDE